MSDYSKTQTDDSSDQIPPFIHILKASLLTVSSLYPSSLLQITCWQAPGTCPDTSMEPSGTSEIGQKLSTTAIMDREIHK